MAGTSQLAPTVGHTRSPSCCPQPTLLHDSCSTTLVGEEQRAEPHAPLFACVHLPSGVLQGNTPSLLPEGATGAPHPQAGL